MKIAIGPLSGEYGGTNQHIINIMKHSRHRFEAVSPRPFSIYFSDNKLKGLARVFLRTCGIERGDIYGLYLSKMLSSRFDIVHLHGNPVFWPEIYHKPKNRRAKYIQSVHGALVGEEDFPKEHWHYKKWRYGHLLKSCRASDMVISVAEWLQKRLFDERIESVYVPNGVSVKECEAANPMRFREKYGISDDFFLFVGSIGIVKRPELFVEIARKMPDKSFVMIGWNVTLKNLRVYMKANVPKNITCLGLLSHCDAIDAIAASKVLILPSKNEAFPVVLLEAMACKIPAAAADNLGPKEIVTHGKDGFLFKPDDVDDLYEKSCKAWEHPEVGERGHKKVREKFDWPIIIKQIDKVYEDVAGS